MPYVAVGYPHNDAHFIQTARIIGPFFNTEKEAVKSIQKGWYRDLDDGFDFGLYVIEVDLKGNTLNVKEVIMLTENIYSKLLDIDKYLNRKKLSSSDKAEALVICWEAIKEMSKKSDIYAPLLQRIEYQIDSETPSIQEVWALVEESAKTIAEYCLNDLPREDNPALPEVASEVDPKIVNFGDRVLEDAGEEGLSEYDVIVGTIAAAGWKRKEAMQAVKDATPPEKKKKKSAKEKAKEKVEREKKRLEPYMAVMSSKSRKAVQKMISNEGKTEPEKVTSSTDITVSQREYLKSLVSGPKKGIRGRLIPGLRQRGLIKKVNGKYALTPEGCDMMGVSLPEEIAESDKLEHKPKKTKSEPKSKSEGLSKAEERILQQVAKNQPMKGIRGPILGKLKKKGLVRKREDGLWELIGSKIVTTTKIKTETDKVEAEAKAAKAKAEAETAKAKAEAKAAKAKAEAETAKAKAEAETAKAKAEAETAKAKAEAETAKAKAEAETAKAKAEAETAKAKAGKPSLLELLEQSAKESL